MAYTLEQLRDDGPQYAMALLLRCIRAGEPFVTYGAIAAELEYQLGVEKIFSTHIGHVAGSLMDRILKLDPRAPLINVLITRPDGVPGKGAGGYLADRYRKSALRKWDSIPRSQKLSIVGAEREKIFQYAKWSSLNRRLFGGAALSRLRVPVGNEHDFNLPAYCGPAESEEHKTLKNWVAGNPRRIGLGGQFGRGEIEARLQSGDEVDVVFSSGTAFRMVEVKSCRSNDEDFRRGVYQCVKYREVKRAEHAPYDVDVDAILVTERELPPELKERASLLGVVLRVVKLRRAAKLCVQADRRR